MFDINLVPEVQKQKQAQVKRNTYATVAAIGILGTVVAALLIMGSLKVAASISLNNTKKDIDEVKAESEKYKELEETVVSLESGLTAIKHSLDGNNNWTLLLPHLESATPQDVSFRTFGIEGATVKATLTGTSVESIARFLKSYEGYKVLVLSGRGEPQGKIAFSMNNSNVGQTTIKSDGTWVYALKLSTTSDFVVETSGALTDKITYNSTTEDLRSESGDITTGVANLFTDLSTKQYTKEGSNVVFDATFNIATGVLW